VTAPGDLSPARNMKVTTRLALAVLPASIWCAIRSELPLTRLRWKNTMAPWRSRRLHRMTDIRLHLGCGKRAASGWVNVDGFKQNGVDLMWDLRSRLPFGNAAVLMIYSEHVLEHLEYEEVEVLLAECHRLLAPNGRIRIGVPDAGIYLRAYSEDRREFFESLQHLGGAARPLTTPIAVINQSFRMGGAHKFAWDFESLRAAFERAGFTAVKQFPSGQASRADLCLDDPSRAFETLYVEAVRPSTEAGGNGATEA